MLISENCAARIFFVLIGGSDWVVLTSPKVPNMMTDTLFPGHRVYLFTGIIRNKTMDDIFIYSPNEDYHKYITTCVYEKLVAKVD